jgi:peptidyl-prolyl cis-trans isomerase A (cyclophilin A)
MRNFIYGVLLSAGALLCGCSSSKPAPPKISNDKAPDIFRVDLDTSKGPVVITTTRDWSPLGADRFYNLVKGGFFDGVRFFRVLPRFVIQFGINGDPSISRLWSNLTIPDDPVKQSNRKGMVTFATGGKDTRTTQIFINMRDNASLDKKGFSPFGEVTAGMDVVERFYAGYGEMVPRGPGPDPTQIETRGNSYLDERFPRLDFIKKATIAK